MDPNQQPVNPQNNPQPVQAPAQTQYQPPAGPPVPPAYQPQTPGAPQPSQQTNGLAIAGLILAFFFPLIGLIVSLIAKSQIKKKGQGGNGIATAGIIISAVFTVLSGLILISLVAATFGGVKNKAKDTERQTDINALYGQIEAYQYEKGYYPTLDELNDANFRSANMPGLESQALTDPEGTEAKLSDTPGAGVYSYVPGPDSCINTGSKIVHCTTYTLTATLAEPELGSTAYVKKNLTY